METNFVLQPLHHNYILTGLLIVELISLFLVKYSSILSSQLNVWYSKFGIMAIIADLCSIIIGFILAKHIYIRLYGSEEFNIWKFAIILVSVQIIHDILFYLLIIKPIPRQHNTMVDLFKDYAIESGWKIVAGDSIIMLLSLLFAILLKNYLPDLTNELAVVVVYTLVYVVYKV